MCQCWAAHSLRKTFLMCVIWKEILFLLFFGSLLYIMPENVPSQCPESQAKVSRCLHGGTRSSWLNSDIQRKHASGGSTERWPRGKPAMLSWDCMDRVRKAKAARRDNNNNAELFNKELRDMSSSSALVLVEEFNFPGINWLVSYSRNKQVQEIAEAHGV